MNEHQTAIPNDLESEEIAKEMRLEEIAKEEILQGLR